MLFLTMVVTGVMGLIAVILLQPRPVTAGLSSNLGPDPGRFEIDGLHMLYRYDPEPNCRMQLEIVGYPQAEQVEGETRWSLYFVDDTLTDARDLLDSALLRIARTASGAK